MDVEYDHAEYVLYTHSQYVNNRHAIKQLVNSDNWSLYWSVTHISNTEVANMFGSNDV